MPRLADLEPRRVAIDDHRANPVRAFSEADEDQEVVSPRGEPGGSFQAVQPTAGLDHRGLRGQVGERAAGVGLGQRDPARRAARDHRGDVLLLLKLGSPLGDEHRGATDGHHRVVAGDRAGVSDALDRQQPIEIGTSRTAELLRQADAEDAQRSELPQVVAWCLAPESLIERSRPELPHPDVVDAIDQILLIPGESEVHQCPLSAVGVRASSEARSSRFKTLPLGFRGMATTKTKRRGALKSARRSPQNRTSSSSSG